MLKKYLNVIWHFLKRSPIIIGIASLIWLLIRTGTKPSRITYPCQKAAANNSIFFLGGIAIPYMIQRMKPIRVSWYILFSIFVILASIFLLRTINKPVNQNTGLNIYSKYEISENISRQDTTSSVFIVKNFPNPSGVYHIGVDSLFSLLAQHGTYFYKSSKNLPWCDTSGMISKNDVVLIKVNGEWPERGMTNTDVIKGVIARIVAHPDTFTGEVCLVENGQWRFAWSYSLNNAEDQSQSMQSVINYFSGLGHHVTGYNWTAIGYSTNNRWVSEYEQGDTLNGYVKEDSSGMTYAKFKTSYGTRISTRKGIWDGASYDNDRLKFINMPVLKSHSLMGVSASIKHYIGFLSYAHIGSSTMHSRVYQNGLLGVNMGKARFPNLNIIDATWVCAEITTGPSSPNNIATRLNTLLASKDPVANDYIAGKRILRPVSWWSGHSGFINYGRMDPDNLNTENPGSGHNYSDGTPCSGMPYNTFHQYLSTTYNKLRQYGHWVTMDTNQMNIYVYQFPSQGIEENKSQGITVPSKFEIYPNPAKSYFTIKLPYANNRTEIKIVDESGKIVDELVSSKAGEIKVPLDRVKNGIYFVKVNDEMVREKLIVMK